MFAHIVVWIISFFLGYYSFLCILRPIILNYKSENFANKIASVIVDLLILAINAGVIMLIYYKFNRTFWTCIGSYITSLIAIIVDCIKERKLIHNKNI